MNTEKQIKALAELDGITGHNWIIQCERGNIKRYHASYDAIIPLLRKQPESVLHKVADAMDTMTTPSQLCEALLRATGKWEE